MNFIFLREVEVPSEHKLITIESACAYMSISKRTLKKSILNGDTPAPITLKNKHIGWSYRVFQRWMTTIAINH